MSRKFLAMCLMFMVASSVVYEVQGTFLLKLYLARRIPRRCIGFTIFATKGMMMLVNSLESGCPATREFKEFFANFKAFMTFISSVSVTSSQNVDVEIEDKANSLFNACSALEGANQKSSNVGDFKTTVMSMAKILIEQKKRGSMIMSFSQKRELVVSMVRWTRIIAQFVKSAAEMRGKSIDISSYGLDVDVNSSIKNEDSSSGSSDSEDSASPKSSRNQNTSYSTKTDTTTGSASSGVSGKSAKTTSGDKFTDTTGSGSPSGSPTGSPSNSTSVSGETVAKGKTTASGNVSSKKKASGTSTKTENESSSSKKSKGASEFKDTTGKTSGSPSGSPTSSPSGSASSSKTSVKGSQNASSMNQESNTEAKKTKTSGSKTTSSAATSVKQVESDTSKEVMSFISELEKKYAGKSELKVFFDKLKTSMSASSKISSTNAQDFLSTMKSAAGKLSEAMIFVSSRFSKSEETKTSMESCQEQVMKTLKELQDINSQIVNGKTVTTTQQTELKQTITKWEQVTAQFVETAASSSFSSSSSQQISGGMTKTN